MEVSKQHLEVNISLTPLSGVLMTILTIIAQKVVLGVKYLDFTCARPLRQT